MEKNMSEVRKLDQNGLKTGQVLTILLLIVAFVLDTWILVAFVAVAQLLGALDVPFAPYRVIYKSVIRPSGLVKPRIEQDNPEPHRFAMLIGAIFNGVATLLLLANIAVIPWVLVAIVIALANLNFWAGFCLGCWMYYQFARLGLPGFKVGSVS